jgi:hypothetical protein
MIRPEARPEPPNRPNSISAAGAERALKIFRAVGRVAISVRPSVGNALRDYGAAYAMAWSVPFGLLQARPGNPHEPSQSATSSVTVQPQSVARRLTRN